MEEKRQQGAPRQAQPGPSQGGNRPGRSPQAKFSPLGGGRSRGGNRSGGGRGRGRLRQGAPNPPQAPPMRPNKDTTAAPDKKPVPPLAPGNICIIPLGGVEEIGRNMTLVE